MNHIEVIFSPALYPFSTIKKELVVVIDIFRATTSICTAFQQGVHRIFSTADLHQAQAMKRSGYQVAAERNTQKCDFADFGNSPFDFTPDKVAGKNIVFTTTNGTTAIDIAKNATTLYLGAFANIDQIVNLCLQSEKEICLLCAGWKNNFSMEDTLFAGAVCERLITTNRFKPYSDATQSAMLLWQTNANNITRFLSQTDHYKRLIHNGLEKDIRFCLQHNTAKVLPQWNKKRMAFELAEKSTF